MSYYVVLCCAMLDYVMLRFVKFCDVVVLCPMLCYFVGCRALFLPFVLLFCAILWFVALYSEMFC